MPALGISNLVDATGLDDLGLPVVLSSRRGGKTRKVHSGKGLSLDDASAGALMEAVEYAVAEHVSARGPDVWLPLNELCKALPRGLRLADFAPRLGVAPSRDERTPAMYCEEIIGRTKALLPAELVLVPCPLNGSVPLFGWSTNGLASGNTLEEATLHALLEILERDSIAMTLAHDESHLVRSASLPSLFQELLPAWNKVGVELIVRFLPNQFGLPCFEAVLHEPARDDLRLARGWGCHLDRDIALARAICESAQSRIYVIDSRRRGGSRRARRAGCAKSAAPHDRRARPANAAHAKQGDREARMLLRMTNTARTIDFAAVPNVPCNSVRSAMRALKGRLYRAGITRIFRRRMRLDGESDALLGLHVVKLVVPMCESAVSSHVRMGPRLLQRIVDKARAQARTSANVR
jgi:ribosomal protein S12 methylthiotransferase accessory factor